MSAPSAGLRATGRARVAIAGNPNTGKTTVFNRLTGAHQKVGNYAGVTVEIHEGRLQLPNAGAVDLLDVPGAYSLSARSREEELAIQAIAGIEPFQSPDLVVVVADATQLSRNLYFVLQVLELGLPCVIALNMTDMLAERGLVVDALALELELGVRVIETAASTGKGMDALVAAIDAELEHAAQYVPRKLATPELPELTEDVRRVSAVLPRAWSRGKPERERALALWALLSLEEQDELVGIPPELRNCVRERRELAAGAGRAIDTEIIQGRYSWIDSRLPRFVREAQHKPRSRTERIDALLLNPVAGFAIFLLLMGIVFQSLFTWASPMMGAIEGVFDAFAGWLRGALPAGLGREFLTEGLIAGVGSVLVFLPQILLLFLFIGLMEDSGYMARVAFLMDRIMQFDRASRARLRADALGLRLRRAGDPGHAHDGAPARPHADDARHPADDLLGAPAGLHADHRRALPAQRGLRLRAGAGPADGRDVPLQHRHGAGRRGRALAHALQGPARRR